MHSRPDRSCQIGCRPAGAQHLHLDQKADLHKVRPHWDHQGLQEDAKVSSSWPEVRACRDMASWREMDGSCKGPVT